MFTKHVHETVDDNNQLTLRLRKNHKTRQENPDQNVYHCQQQPDFESKSVGFMLVSSKKELL